MFFTQHAYVSMSHPAWVAVTMRECGDDGTLDPARLLDQRESSLTRGRVDRKRLTVALVQLAEAGRGYSARLALNPD